MFDPTTVPVTRVDPDLLPVSPDALTATALRHRFQAPPQWEPEIAREPRFTDRPLRHAAVLVPLVMRARPTLLLTQRTAELTNHAGQIAFPGGKQDDSDPDAVAAALRETQEEVGLDPNRIEVLGTLPHYRTGSAYVVTPVVALIEPGFTLSLNSFEVAEAFEVPLDFLMNPSNHRWHTVQWEGVDREWLSMPYQDRGRERFIWGATAGMLRNFYRFLVA